ESITGVDVQNMRAVEQAFAPTGDEIALAVEHHHRVVAAVEDVDAVLTVDRDRSGVRQAPARGQFCEILHHAVAVFARAENGHVCLPLVPVVIPGWSVRTRPRISRFSDA